jgi:hypothetical protein
VAGLYPAGDGGRAGDLAHEFQLREPWT